MTKDEFAALFDKALATAVADTEQRLKRPIPRDLQIELHGAGHPGDLLSRAEAADTLHLGDNKFYLVIDVAVIAVSGQFTLVFVRARSHEPGSFNQTWNDPPGSGPFKQVIAKKIDYIES